MPRSWNASTQLCLPLIIRSSRMISAFFLAMNFLIAALAELDATKSNQPSLGPGEVLLVLISTMSPVLRTVLSGTITPLTRAPTH